MPDALYTARRMARSEFVPIRGLRHHLLHWGGPQLATPERPPLLMMHGWMDIGASFQFVVDALAQERWVIAPDWRGFGLSDAPSAATYWFADYIADLDGMVDAVLAQVPGQTHVDLLGHSMGGNAVMIYAGVRPERVRRLINLEGFSMPATVPQMAPGRFTKWLDEIKTPVELRDYDSADAVAARLQKTNPLLRADRAAWLAQRWARPDAQGRWRILADANHKRNGPLLFQKDEVLACWSRITAPLLWIESDRTDLAGWFGTRYGRDEFYQRLNVVPQVEQQVISPAGHMLHHDQPEALAARLEAFLGSS